VHQSNQEFPNTFASVGLNENGFVNFLSRGGLFKKMFNILTVQRSEFSQNATIAIFREFDDADYLKIIR
jgi:hypothetical protein